jgi:hypothetical protein
MKQCKKIITLVSFCLLLNSCANKNKISDQRMEKLRTNFSTELWEEVLNDNFRLHDIFDENGKKNITVNIGEYSSIGSTESSLLKVLKLVKFNKKVNGDLIAVVTEEAKDNYGKNFQRNAALLTFPLSKINPSNLAGTESSYIVYGYASKIVVFGPKTKSSILRRCSKQSTYVQVPNLCKSIN